jgi:serine/threonine protein kinase/class 3 adenylate cyclase
VYLAHDATLDRDVAIAVIKTDGLDEAGLDRVKREAQAMGRLGDHPNIVTIHDIGDDAGQPYIVSQYMAGGDLAMTLQQHEGHQLSIDEATAIADQICAGLEHAHARGIVHRDLKPGNIWFDSSGVAKIGDFGLAVALDRSRLTMAGMMVGTASYMPPEQAMGGQTTRASDLYAVGCVLYEMISGRPPFVGDDTVAVISQHVNTAPVSPAWHNSECPPALEALIIRLLEKDANQRPSGAGEVREVLTTLGRGSTPAPQPVATSARPDQQANPIYRRTFVGREQELKQLEAAFDSALSGQGSLLMIVGEPGIGKTTITEQLSTYVGMRGGRSLVGHCYEEGSLSLPYLPFVEAMRDYVIEHDREQLSEELGQGAADIARIVSEVRDRVNVVPASVGSPEEERFRLFQAVTTFLRSASSTQPLCLVLEDLHDADKGTMEMLVHLGRNLAGARILLAGTYRDVEVDRTHPLSAALAELRRVDSFARLPLRGLSPPEVHRMLSNIAGQDIPYELAEAVYRQTEGNPLFIQEVIRYAAESGLIRREGDQWVATVDSLITQIPEGLRDVIGRRLSGLGEECNRILSIAAVIGRDFAVDVLRKLAGASEDELLAALEEATRVSLIEEMRGQRELRYRFTHAFFRQTLYEELIAPRRLRIHNEVAKALEEHYTGRVEEHAAELAEHYAHSSSEEDLHKAVRFGEMAAERAASVYAFGEASRLYEQAIEVQEIVAPNDSQRLYDLWMRLGECLLPAGEAERVYKEIAKRAYELAEKMGGGTSAARAAEIAASAMVYHEGVACFLTPEYRSWGDIMDKNAAAGSRERVFADIWPSWTTWLEGDPKATWPLRRNALELARRLEEPDALSQALFAFITAGSPIAWEPEKLEAAQQLKDLSRVGVPPNLLGQMLWSVADILCDAGDIDAARAIWEELDAYADRIEDPYVRSWQMFSLSSRTYYAGDLEKVVEMSRDLEGRAEAMGIPAWGRLVATWMLAAALPRLGRFDETLEALWAQEALPYGDATAAAAYGTLGRLNECRETVNKTLERLNAIGDEWADRVTLLALLDAATNLNDKELVARLYDRLQDTVPFSNNNGAVTRGRILGSAARLLDKTDEARAHYEDGLAVATKIGNRPEAALIRHLLAQLLFERFPDDKMVAAEHLTLATQEAQAMKMQPLLEDCLALKLRFQGITSTDLFTSIDTVAQVVEAEQPDLRSHAAPDGTVTLMFSDIEASTALADRLGDNRFMDVLREHNAIVRDQVRAFAGYEVKSEGDGFMVAFQSARAAVDCATAIQRALAQRNERAEEPVRVRIGLHVGETIRDQQDFFGRNVILAARIAGQASGGQIYVSPVLKALVESAGDLEFSEARTVELKGLSGEHSVHELVWSRFSQAGPPK